MATVSAAEFQRNFERYRDMAQREPVTVTSCDKDSVVLISIAEYKRLRALDDRKTQYIWDMSEKEIELLAASEPPSEAEAFNDEYTPS